MEYVLTKEGKAVVASYIRELEAKRKEILDARMDTADDTTLPTEEDILEDILEDICSTDIDWDDPDGPCCRSLWAVTDHYEADEAIALRIGQDIKAVP